MNNRRLENGCGRNRHYNLGNSTRALIGMNSIHPCQVREYITKLESILDNNQESRVRNVSKCDFTA
jgi:hypothetical protein